MIIHSSDELPRRSFLKRYPLPNSFHTAPESRIQAGHTRPEPAEAQRLKRLQVYRYDPESAAPPLLQRRAEPQERDLRDHEGGTP